MTFIINSNNFKLVWGVVRDRGVLNVLRHVYYDFMFDSRFGVDTINVVTNEDLVVESDNKQYGGMYQGIPVLMFDEMIAQLKIDFQESTFIDFGSGKGKALLLASRLGFKKIIGVEYSPELVEICKKNIDRYCKKVKTSSIFRVICSDAAEFDIPADANYLFFYNPFGEVVVQKVLAKVEESMKKNPREIWILYVRHLLSIFKDNPKIELVKADPDWHIYRLPPASA